MNLRKLRELTRLTIGLIFLVSCQAYNSSSQDSQRFAGDSPEAQARAVLATHCSECHSFSTTSTSSLIATGHLTVENPSASTLLTQVRGANLGGAENMPPNDSLSSDDINALLNWIESL